MAVATSLVIAGAVAAAAGATTQGIAARRAKNETEDQNNIKNTQQAALDSLVEERPTFQNPYENMTNQFENLDNPYANLTVATEAFKMQAEQADQALANSLDVMMETGQAAGGATALAQAALQSKKGVSAGIEQQEVSNQQNAAKAEMQLDQAKMTEQQRLQGINMSEAERMQMADAQGKDYVFKATETRQVAGLDRAQAQIENAQASVAANQAARDGAIGSAIGGLGAVASSVGGLVEENKLKKLDTRNPEETFKLK